MIKDYSHGMSKSIVIDGKIFMSSSELKKYIKENYIPIEWLEKVRKRNEERTGLRCWILVCPGYPSIDFSNAVDLVDMWRNENEN